MIAEQLDLFVDGDRYALPTRQSATGVVERTARRLGYDYVALCAHCGCAVVLVGRWRPDGWFHRETGRERCAVSALAQRARYGLEVAR
jgi:hypothetical protein